MYGNVGDNKRKEGKWMTEAGFASLLEISLEYIGDPCCLESIAPLAKTDFRSPQLLSKA